MLEGIDNTEGFRNGAADGEVVDDLVSDDSFFVDEEETAVGDAFLRVQHAVFLADGFIDVGDKRVVDALDAPLGFWGIEPSEVGVDAVDRAGDDLGISFFKLFEKFLEGVEFCWADKSEVQRVKEEDDIFAAEVVEVEVADDLVADNGFCVDRRGMLADENCHIVFLFYT